MYKINITGLSPILASSNKTLLENMESANLQPEYHCRDGHCGACKCTLVSGEIEEIGFKMAYTSEGEILPCISRAKTDLLLEKVNYQIKAKSA
ncbi:MULTISPECIES: 2Fe-2S iron-sulfur cluster-binding protein [unclassified Vibrio]|uniref:2Fe-2S iron-sulfur cluster-binding protein n=1 Tax=unclassified Vibrio TaxID=2614977 RepID=UPI0014933089|nr:MULTISPECIES: 2Fe-2S iron-sulfur cluster-binding protein [unclassified Vibrio]NOI67937.1 2Fe-2S iron-sulfur cluster binding domain-containing protein [Vibrio sp. 99-8-1]